MPGSWVSGEDCRVGQLRHLAHAGQRSVTASAVPVARVRASHRMLAGIGGLAVIGGLIAGCGSGSGSAVTRVTQAANAQVIRATGQTVAARAGLTLHVGDELRTGPDGDVVLATGDRRAYLGGQGSYTVRGRSAGLLSRGAFVVDGRRGPALSITSGSVTARVGRSAVRVEHGFAVRVGVLAGRAVSVTADPASGAQQLTVPSLYQAVVAGRGLDGATPLTLIDDDAERLVVPDLVGDDIQLNLTATALDTGTEGRAIVRISSAGFGAAMTAHRSVSETALPMAMARAVTSSQSDRTALQHNYDRATTLRSEGGSWAVVARLIGTDATATGRAIDALLTGVPSAGTVLAVAPVVPANGSGTSTDSRSRSSSGNNPSTSGDDGGSTPPPNNNPGSGPSPTPSPTPGPLQQVVDGIIGVLPPPLSKPAPSPSSCRLLGLLNC